MKATILLVEDDAATRDRLRLALESERYRVIAAKDGADALEKLDGQLPSLILVDWLRSKVDGVTFVHELERRGLQPEVPIMALSVKSHGWQKAEELDIEGCLLRVD